MNADFPGAVPEIPVSHVDQAVAYYQHILGFNLDWGDEAGGIAGISKDQCRLFLTNPTFRQMNGNCGPTVIWLNLNSREAVDGLFQTWERNGAKIVLPPESKPWKLHEFTAADLDGNLLRVFYDLAWESAPKSNL